VTRKRIVGLVAILAALTFAGLVAYTWPVSLRTHPDTIGCALMSLDGTIHGDRWASPPVWVDGDPEAHVEIVWSAGYSARFTPNLQLIDEHGNVVAREGDRLRLIGRSSNPTLWVTCGAPQVVGKS
jgi:hypothetical protein